MVDGEWQKLQKRFMYARIADMNLLNGMAVAPNAGNGTPSQKRFARHLQKAPSVSVPLGTVAPAGYNPSEIMKLKDVDSNSEVRYHTGISELDRVLGGGIVRGSLVLLGGDPGLESLRSCFKSANIWERIKNTLCIRRRKPCTGKTACKEAGGSD